MSKNKKPKLSFLNSNWLRALIIDINDIVFAFNEDESLFSNINFQLVIITSIAIISTVFHRVIAYACKTYGVITFWPLFMIFLILELIRMMFWIVPAIVFAIILQNKKVNPLKIQFFPKEIIVKIILYFYCSIHALNFLTSWLFSYERDRAEIALPMHYYGSLTYNRIDPLFRFIASLWNQTGWYVILLWLIFVFLFIFRYFTKPTTKIPKDNPLKQKSRSTTTKVRNYSLLIFPIIWLINITIFEFFLTTEILYFLLGI